MLRHLSAFAIATAAFGAVPAAAQDEAGDRVNMVIIYGDDECPPSTDGEITVCARKAEAERYRIPERLRSSTSPANQSWTERVERYETVGNFGIMSCSPTGTGGEGGCTQQMIDAAYRARQEGSDVRFGQLIEEARAERLSTIDQEAAEEQARVEQLEKAYMEKLERERQGPVPGEPATAAPTTTEDLTTPPVDETE